MPLAYQWVTLHVENPRIPNRTEEAISFQSYADRDGVFAKSPTYTSPGGHVHSYDQHTGAVDWEIWVGVLPRYKGDLTQTAAAINRYFAKNHAFRARRLLIARGSTNNSGGLGANSDGFFGLNIATALAADEAFGDAILGHVNLPLIDPWSASREFHFATNVVLGDPTLRRSNGWKELIRSRKGL